MNKQNLRIIYFVVTIIVFLSGFLYRIADLESDPPMYYSGLGQSLSTDPAQYTFHTKNKILYDDFDPFDYSRWTVYQHSLTSLVAYLCFSLSDVSLYSSNLVGVILSMGGLLLLSGALIKRNKEWVLLTTVLLFSLNVSLITYGRLSYLENGLIFLCGLLFYVYVKFSDKMWGLILSAFVASLAMLVGKLFGVLLFPALLLTVIIKEKEKKWSKLIITASSFIVSTILVSFILYGWDISTAFGYIGEQSYGLRGFPEGLKTPWDFLEHLISFGYQNRLFYLNIDLVLFLVFSSTLLIYQLSSGFKLSEIPKPVIFTLSWIIFVILGMMPLNYSPLRYSLFLIPAIILFFCFVFEWVLGKSRPENPGKIRWIVYLLPLVVIWQGLFQIAALIFYENNAPIRMMTWVCLPIALVLVFLLKKLFESNLKFSKIQIKIALYLLVIISIVTNLYWINDKLEADDNKNIIEANDDLAKIVGEGAVISGPYGPVLTVNNGLKSFIHLFGVVDPDSSFFDKYPITHIAVDQSNLDEAKKTFPELSNMVPITFYWIRDYKVEIYNISKLYNNPQANKYPETMYERAVAYYYRGFADSSMAALSYFINNRPGSKSAEYLYSTILFTKGDYRKATSVTSEIVDNYPTDFYLNLHAGRIYQILGLINQDNYYSTEARRYYEKATILNPYKAAFANQLYESTNQQILQMIENQKPKTENGP